MESTGSSNLSMTNGTRTSGFNRSSTRKTETSKNGNRSNKAKEEKNPFMDSIGDSSIQELELQQTLKKNPYQFKLTQREVQNLTKQYASKRYGKNIRMVLCYGEMVSRIIKSEEMRCSLDFLTKLDTNLFNCIMTDFKVLTSIMIYSDRCGPKEYQKFEDSYRRGNKKARIQDFMLKSGESGKKKLEEGEDKSQQRTPGIEQANQSMVAKTQEKKCSANWKINHLIVPGIVKNVTGNSNLTTVHFMHYRFAPKSWQEIGEAIGQSKSIKVFICNVCNLNQNNNLELLMKGLIENNIIERLDLSDNQISDADSLNIIRFMKKQSEKRENRLWMNGLRHSNLEKKSYNVQNQPIENDNQLINLIMQPNSPYKNLQLIQTRYNQKKDRIQNRKGLREVILKRNHLGEVFIENLAKFLRYDRFIKVIDIASNQFEQEGIKNLIKFSLKENQSLVALDITHNPGCNEKHRKQIALCLLKNIEYMKRSEVQIKDEWIRPEILTFKIPKKILQELGISYLAEQTSQLNRTFDGSFRSNSNSRSPATKRKQPSITYSTFNHKDSSKTRNLSRIRRQGTETSKERDKQFSTLNRGNKILQTEERRTTSQSQRVPQRKQSDQVSTSNRQKSATVRNQQKRIVYQNIQPQVNNQSSAKKPPRSSNKKKIDEPEIMQTNITPMMHKSNSFSDFQVTNLNKSSKKIDFSIVEQKVEPIEIFTNLSECDIRESTLDQRQAASSIVRTNTQSRQPPMCQNCKTAEKQYFQAEAKFLKAQDKILKLTSQLKEAESEIQQFLNGGGSSLLPQTQDDAQFIQELGRKEPEKVVSRIDILMTELNFLMGVVRFKQMDKPYSQVVQQHLEQLIEISEKQGLLVLEQGEDEQYQDPIVIQNQRKDQKDQQRVQQPPIKPQDKTPNHLSNGTVRSEQPIDDPESPQLIAEQIKKAQKQFTQQSASKTNQLQNPHQHKQATKKPDDYEEYPHPYTLDEQEPSESQGSQDGDRQYQQFLGQQPAFNIPQDLLQKQFYGQSNLQQDEEYYDEDEIEDEYEQF